MIPRLIIMNEISIIISCIVLECGSASIVLDPGNPQDAASMGQEVATDKIIEPVDGNPTSKDLVSETVIINREKVTLMLQVKIATQT